MADMKPLLRREPDENFLSEDDPLAELARIVGFEPKVEPRASAGAVRREPEFDLEDELLKEFEQYSAPEPVAARSFPDVEPVFSPAEPVMPADRAYGAEREVLPADENRPLVDEVDAPDHADDDADYLMLGQSAPSSEPSEQDFALLDSLERELAQPIYSTYADPLTEEEEPLEPAFAVPPVEVPTQPSAPSVFDLEDMILREFSAFDARRTPVEANEAGAVRAEVARHEPTFEQTWSDDNAAVAASVQSGAEDHAEQLIDAAQAYYPEVNSSSNREDSDIDTFAPVNDDSDEEAATSLDDDYWADLGAEVDARAAQLPDQPSALGEEPALLHDGTTDDLSLHPVPHDEHEYDLDLLVDSRVDEADASKSVDVERVEAAVEPPATSIPLEAGAASASHVDDYGLDELLAEVEQFPVSDISGRWGVQARPAEEAAPIAPPASVLPPITVSSHEVETATSGDSDAAYDHDFLDGADALNELVLPATPADQPADAASEPELSVQSAAFVQASAASEPIGEQEQSSAADEEFGNFELDFDDIELDLSELSDPVTASAGTMAELAAAEVTPQPAASWAAPAPPKAEDYSSLPFDPTQVVSEDEPVEAISELDVPESPALPEENADTVVAGYDLDLDAEMADLFASSVDPMPAAALASQQAAAGQPQYNAMELDEFERALEEDFRQSLKQNRTAIDPDRVSLAPPAAVPSRRSSSRWPIYASAAVVLLLAGSAGVYALMSGESKIQIASGEPKIILADKDPVRVVPEDKGGRTVPNQDKAVYDRVAGTQTDVAKQESLVSSSEEPVDVVQKTLMPENMPMDDDSLAGTATEDTTDPRLLPEDEQVRTSTANKVVSGVSPRKVKTMVVKADGTLVPREDVAEDVQQQAVNDAELMKIAQKAATDASTATAPADEVAKAIESVPERLGADSTADAAAEPADAATKPADAASESAQRSVDVPAEDTAVTTTETAPVDVEPAAETAAAATDEKPIDSAPTQTETPEETAALTDQPATDAATEAASEEPQSTVDSNQAVTEPTETAAADTNTSKKPATENTAADASANVPADAAPAADSTIAAAADAEVEETAPIRKVKTSTFTPIPENRPIDQPVNVVGRVTERGNVDKDQPTEVAAADAAAQPAATTASPGGYVIQIASLPSEAEAKSSYAKLSNKFGSVIGGRGVDIRKAQIKNKGTYYRVRVLAGSKAEAEQLCAAYKQAGGSCLVSR